MLFRHRHVILKNRSRNTNMKQHGTLVQNMVASAAATGVAEIITLPICTIKTNHQTKTTINIPTTIRTIYNRSGVFGFYRASAPALGSQILSTSLKYSIYLQLQNAVGKNDPVSNVAYGLVAGVSTSLLTHPIEFFKISMQRHVTPMQEVRLFGPGVVYRGYSKNIFQVVISSILFFPVYDTVNRKVQSPLIASFISACISTTLMQPVDYAKTVHIAGGRWNHGFSLAPYFRGYTLNMLRVVPHFVIVMTIAEAVKNRL